MGASINLPSSTNIQHVLSFGEGVALDAPQWIDIRQEATVFSAFCKVPKPADHPRRPHYNPFPTGRLSRTGTGLPLPPQPCVTCLPLLLPERAQKSFKKPREATLRVGLHGWLSSHTCQPSDYLLLPAFGRDWRILTPQPTSVFILVQRYRRQLEPEMFKVDEISIMAHP